jgi:hypothetical protein
MKLMSFLVATAVIILAQTPLVCSQEISVEKLPAVVVKTVPEAGQETIDASLTEIKVVFSKPMMAQSWSWGKLTDESFPEIDKTRPIRFDADQKTAILPVKLEKNRTYAIWLNTANLQNFKDNTGLPAVPYLLVFKTGP